MAGPPSVDVLTFSRSVARGGAAATLRAVAGLVDPEADATDITLVEATAKLMIDVSFFFRYSSSAREQTRVCFAVCVCVCVRGDTRMWEALASGTTGDRLNDTLGRGVVRSSGVRFVLERAITRAGFWFSIRLQEYKPYTSTRIIRVVRLCVTCPSCFFFSMSFFFFFFARHTKLLFLAARSLARARQTKASPSLLAAQIWYQGKSDFLSGGKGKK